MRKQLTILGPGVLLCLAVTLPAWSLGRLFPLIGGPVFGILSGMAITMLFPRLLTTKLPAGGHFESEYYILDPGVKYTSKKLLQYSIVLLGFEMNLTNVIKVGSQSLLVMLFTLSSSFITAFFVGKALKIHGKTATLIGVGTSICGGSAIAATAPVIQAESEEVAQAISTIFLFNVLAVFIFPAMGHALGMSDTGFGLWAGTAINDTSSVVAAGAAWSAVAGNNTALTFATVVKLTRTLMIVPVSLALAIYTARKSRESAENNFSFRKVFPWFVLGFAAVVVINTFAGVPEVIAHWLVTVGKFVIVMAMTAIGLNTNLKKLITHGFRPILLGFSCWLAVAGVSLVVQIMGRMW
ncbi:MAG TPA: YeiH family protein [Bacillota bacterium]|nr:YeiH family protein [Bacillota bacterium]